MRQASTIASAILAILFPLKCLSCRTAGKDICNDCLHSFPPAERESEPWIFPVFDYRHPPVKKALWLLKYKNKKRIAGIFAPILYGRILEEISELALMENFTEPIVIPIPLSKARYKERGYNQAELLTREIVGLDSGENLKLETSILIKPKETDHQARIKNRSERLKNLTGTFAVIHPGLVVGKNIILIDDITTTGATLSEAKKVLKKAGARKVIAFTVAH